MKYNLQFAQALRAGFPAPPQSYYQRIDDTIALLQNRDEAQARIKAKAGMPFLKAALNAAVSPAAVEPTANTNMDANTAQNGIDTIKNGIAQSVDEKYNDIRGDINGKADGTAETEAGGNAGVSGQTVTVPDSGMAQGLPGMDGRTDYRGIGSPVKDIIRQQGATPVDLRTATDPSSFYAAISDAKRGNPHGAFVTAHDVSEYGYMKMFLSDDNGVGVAVAKDGDIVSVFKNPNISKSRKAVSSILLTSIDNGGVKLDNYNGELSRMYLAHGFIPVARTAFVDEYAPSDWNYERDGRPDIIFWRHNGNNVETVARNIGTQEMPDLKALPLMEYDEAAAYRDGLIGQEVLASNNNDVVFKTGTTQEGERSRTTSLPDNSISNPDENSNPVLKDLGANTPSPVEMKQSKVYTNTYDKWLTEAEKSADSVENSMYAVSREADTLSNAREIVRGAIENDGNLDGAMRRLNHGIWDATDVDTAMLIGETLRAEAAETGDYSLGDITRGKTATARRSPVLPPIAKKIIDDQIAMLKAAGIVSPWLFPKADVTQSVPNDIYRRWLTYRKQYGITSVTIHEMRHTSVSYLQDEVPLNALKHMVGHTKNMDTSRIYGHEIDGEAEQTARTVEAVFSKLIK